MNLMRLVIGDWSDDGHGKSDEVLVNVNVSVEEVQNAYKSACRLTGISFNHNNDFTGRKRNWEDQKKYHIATGYASGLWNISDECKKVLTEYGIDYESIIEKDGDLTEIFTELWFSFVELALPELKWSFQKEENKIPVINGYWNKNLNVQFGYGLYE